MTNRYLMKLTSSKRQIFSTLIISNEYIVPRKPPYWLIDHVKKIRTNRIASGLTEVNQNCLASSPILASLKQTQISAPSLSYHFTSLTPIPPLKLRATVSIASARALASTQAHSSPVVHHRTASGIVATV